MNSIMAMKNKFTFGRKTILRIISGVLVIAIIGSLGFYGWKKTHPAAKPVAAQQTAVVRKGGFSVTVSGGGPVAASNKSEVTPKTNATVTKVYFKEGDTVKAGDLLFDLDDSTAKLNVEKAKASLAQTELTQKSNVSSLQKLKVTAPFSGQVTGLTIKQGDVLNKNGAVLTLVDSSKLKLTVPFNSYNVSEITLGKKVTVYVQSLMQSVEGVVSYVNNTSFSTSTGGELQNVEISVNNPGSLTEGMKANVEISTSKGTISSTDNGTFSYVDNQSIKSETGGTVTKVNVKEGQYVKAGETLIEVNNDDLVLNKESTDVKLLEQNGQVKSAEDELSYYKIYAPIDGVIIKQTIKEGEQAKSGQVITTISNTTQMECAIPIDELDIAKLKVGQKATIIADALPETSTKPLEGEVTKIAIEGTSSNGVTTYPVTIKISNPQGLRTGMNVTANVLIDEKKDILYLPIEAIQKVGGRNFVMVKTDGSSAPAQGQPGAQGGKPSGQGDAQRPEQGSTQRPAGDTQRSAQGYPGNNGNGNGNGTNRSSSQGGGRTQGSGSTGSNGARGNANTANAGANTMLKPVEVGINNENYIEIKSGLSEGDQVILPTKTTGTNTMGGMGGMMGGASFGGVMGGAARPAQGGGGQR